MMPERNSIDEMCPSPVARRLITKRKAPGGTSLWSGWGTIEGLKSAADSKAYSPENIAPMSSLRSCESSRCVNTCRSTIWK